MPTVYIDGQAFEYAEDEKRPLLQFAIENGVEIPYFCYHPSMSVPTNCRMCLVEVGMPMRDRATGEPVLDDDGNQKIQWGRKPNTSCNTRLSPGMVVKTSQSSETIATAQKGVLEFMLINHPLDCPICDQAGECPLQIQTYKFGPEGSRFEVEKVHKPKRIELGPRVVLDAERCINCTRCTRFTHEISGSGQLSIIARGEKNFPAAAPGTSFDEPYSMNVIDLCPVGALTSDNFRFQARVWEMNYTPSICTDCAKGCSIDVWVRDNEVLRLTPRKNEQVNDYWMCDEGRLGFEKYNFNRVNTPKLAGDVPVTWEEAYTHAADLLKKHKGKVLFLASALSGLENNLAMQQFAQEQGGDLFFTTHEIAGRGDDFLRKDDITPNTKGCEALNITALSEAELESKLKAGVYELVYMLEDVHAMTPVLREFNGPVVMHATHYVEGFEKAAVILPAAMEIEQPQSFMNIDGVVQTTEQSRQIKHMTPEDWMFMSKSRLDAAGQLTDRWRKEEHILDVHASWRILSEVSQKAEGSLRYNSFKEVVSALKSEGEAFEDIKLRKRPPRRAFKHSQFDFALDLQAKTY